MSVITASRRCRFYPLPALWTLFVLLAAPGLSQTATAQGQRESPPLPRGISTVQEKPAPPIVHSPGEPAAPMPTPLSALIAEAEKNDPAILAAGDAVRAAAQMPAQASAFPDPQFTFELFSVGSPKPFAGYTNSDFSFIGAGVSQQLPYAGKRRLRGAVAEREGDVRRQDAEVVHLEELEKLKGAYYRIAYLQRSLAIHHRHDALVREIAEAAQILYRAGHGNQQDLLRAQLERTRVLREISMNQLAAGEAQAELKRILHREQDSPDIVAEPLAAAPLSLAPEELLARAREQSPDVRERAEMVRKGQAEVDLARREFRPDFGLSYMYQNTDRIFRDYYVFSFNVNFPLRKPRQAALAQASINVERAQREQELRAQAVLAGVKKEIIAARASEEQARIYRDGLIPQARATYQAGMAAYESGREDFQTLLSSALDVLNLDLEYQQTLLEHQLALVRIERLTGATLP